MSQSSSTTPYTVLWEDGMVTKFNIIAHNAVLNVVFM